MIILERFMDHSRAPSMGSLGELYIGGEFVCYTIEQDWQNNKPFKSCVPVGEYDLIEFTSPKYGQTVALHNPELNVYAHQSDAGPGDRYACLFHTANWSHQLQGCIAPGKAIAWGQDRRRPELPANIMVTSSGSTFEDLLPNLYHEKLLIRWKHQR